MHKMGSGNKQTPKKEKESGIKLNFNYVSTPEKSNLRSEWAGAHTTKQINTFSSTEKKRGKR